MFIIVVTFFFFFLNCAHRVSYIVNRKEYFLWQVLIIDHADVIAMQVCGAVNLIARNMFVAVNMEQIVKFISYTFFFFDENYPELVPCEYSC